MLLVTAAWCQTCYWCDSETLWTRTLACTPQNNLVHHNLGMALADCGRLDEAMVHYRRALDIKPGFTEGHNNLGIVLAKRGQLDEAMEHFRRPWTSSPTISRPTTTSASPWRGADGSMRRWALEEALKCDPDAPSSHYNLGLLWRRGRIDEAMAHYRGP